jgi:uncharacterized protein YndB with AHSA1/START domain
VTDAVRITRILPAPPDRVWAALTRAEALAAWFWPASFGTHIEMDKDGYRIEAKHPVMAVSGRYVEVDPPRRLVFTWRWDGDDDESLVTMELEPVGEHTQLRLVHEPHTNAHEQGWNDCLDRLPGFLTSSSSLLLPGHG